MVKQIYNKYILFAFFLRHFVWDRTVSYFSDDSQNVYCSGAAVLPLLLIREWAYLIGI